MLIYASMITYLIFRLITIFSTREHTFIRNEIVYTEDEMADFGINVGKFNNSMNFAFGLKGNDIREGVVDILNNPYVRFIGMEKDGVRTYHEKYEFELCSDEHKLRFM